MKDNPTDGPAFSLIEVVLVIAIMGVLLVVAQPRFASVIQNERLRRAANKLTTDILLAQSEAIKQQGQTSVEFSLDADAYRLVGMSAAADGSTDYEVFLGADKSYRTNLVTANFDDQLEFQFDRYGVPNSGGKITLGIGRLRIILTVDADTGRVTIGSLLRTSETVGAPAHALPTNVVYGGAAPSN